MHTMSADGRPRTRFALWLWLERQAGLQVLGEAADFDELLAAGALVSKADPSERLLAAIADCRRARPTAASVKVRQLCISR